MARERGTSPVAALEGTRGALASDRPRVALAVLALAVLALLLVAVWSLRARLELRPAPAPAHGTARQSSPADLVLRASGLRAPAR